MYIRNLFLCLYVVFYIYHLIRVLYNLYTSLGIILLFIYVFNPLELVIVHVRGQLLLLFF